MSSGPPPPRQGHPVYLIGDPVDHSLSPVIHNAAFRAQNLDLEYRTWRVPKENLESVLGQLYSLGAVGANITVPHKQAAHKLIGDLSTAAAETGAVNTLVRTPTGWRGETTDVEGFLAPLRERRLHVDGGSALVLGAGGAARAVVYGLLREYSLQRILVAARRLEQAEALCTTLSGAKGQASGVWRKGQGVRGKGQEARPATIEACSLASVVDVTPRLIVNATPVGMHPNENDSPLPEAFYFQGVEVAYDLIYNPSQTAFLSHARSSGAQIINGLPMLIAQAAASFRLWTGREMDVEAVQSALADSSS